MGIRHEALAVTGLEPLDQLIARASKAQGAETVNESVRTVLTRLANGESWIEVSPEFVSNVARTAVIARRVLETLKTMPDSHAIQELDELVSYFEANRTPEAGDCAEANP